MNNEPVAKVTAHGIYLEYPLGLKLKIGTKLYTHPVKELTDEEIISTMVQFDVYSSDDHCLIEAGRAILRKAQNG